MGTKEKELKELSEKVMRDLKIAMRKMVQKQISPASLSTQIFF